jgi:hypothetical protein
MQKKRKNIARYLPNPRDGWGPGSRAHCGRKKPKLDSDEAVEQDGDMIDEKDEKDSMMK